MIKALYAVQLFLRDKWQTVNLSSYYGDAEAAFHDACELYGGHLRLVKFKVDGTDFVATYCRDFAILDRCPPLVDAQ